MADTNVDTIDTTKQTILNINMSNVTKLTSSNYMTWSLQVRALVNGYALGHHLDGSKPAPPATIQQNGETVENPAYDTWYRQDQLLYSGLIGALSLPVQSKVSLAKTSADIWHTLNSTYAKPSRGHIKQLRIQLKNNTKGTKTIDEYMQGLTTKFDQLALLGQPMAHEDQLDLVLLGLPEEYKTVAYQLEGREVSPSLVEAHEKLINHEANLLTEAPPVFSPPVSANVATNRPRNQHQRQNSRHHNSGYPSSWTGGQQQLNTFRPDSRPGRGYQGKCQICGVFGHSARRCNQLTQQTSNLPFTTPYHSSAQSSSTWQPRANLAFNTTSSATPWLLDSGATHHLTNDLDNLSHHQPYNGTDNVIIGDGYGIPITHSGSITLPAKSHSLILNNVLCVPTINKNLISIYRLCNTNNVSVEFFPKHFQVKALCSGTQLLQGRTRDELYEWPTTNPPSAYFISSTPKANTEAWHYRLGHPSLSVLQNIFSAFSIPVSKEKPINNLCLDCALNKSHKLPFYQTTIHSTRPLEYIFTDLWTSPILSTSN